MTDIIDLRIARNFVAFRRPIDRIIKAKVQTYFQRQDFNRRRLPCGNQNKMTYSIHYQAFAQCVCFGLQLASLKRKLNEDEANFLQLAAELIGWNGTTQKETANTSESWLATDQLPGEHE